ncbi:hypothetical protein [Salininema proteolyticum]|uniref:SWIM-type domain-containing protein n=1 Tax=Salininema proteolyticum TaxID=1607685 RepID=A0ABV8U3N0_9ACTN
MSIMRSLPDRRPRRVHGGPGFDTAWGRHWWMVADDFLSFDSDLPRRKRGIDYAYQEAVHDLYIRSGFIAAAVHGSRGYGYDVQISVGTDSYEVLRELRAQYSDAEFLRLMSDPGSADHLLWGSDIGTDLYPPPESFESDCACPDWAPACKHVVAVLVAVGWAIDTDPPKLLALTGIELDPDDAPVPADDSVGRTTWTLQAQEGTVLVAEALSREPVPLPDQVDPPETPGEVSFDSIPGSPAFFHRDELQTQAQIAVHNAFCALMDGLDPNMPPWHGLPTNEESDIALVLTRAATPYDFGELAQRADLGQKQAAFLARAHLVGGQAGIDVLTSDFTPDDDMVAEAKEAFAELGIGSPRRRLNRWTFADGSTQLRYGECSMWYTFVKTEGLWFPQFMPSTTAKDALRPFCGQPASPISPLED